MMKRTMGGVLAAAMMMTSGALRPRCSVYELLSSFRLQTDSHSCSFSCSAKMGHRILYLACNRFSFGIFALRRIGSEYGRTTLSCG